MRDYIDYASVGRNAFEQIYGPMRDAVIDRRANRQETALAEQRRLDAEARKIELAQKQKIAERQQSIYDQMQMMSQGSGPPDYDQLARFATMSGDFDGAARIRAMQAREAHNAKLLEYQMAKPYFKTGSGGGKKRKPAVLPGKVYTWNQPPEVEETVADSASAVRKSVASRSPYEVFADVAALPAPVAQNAPASARQREEFARGLSDVPSGVPLPPFGASPATARSSTPILPFSAQLVRLAEPAVSTAKAIAKPVAAIAGAAVKPLAQSAKMMAEAAAPLAFERVDPAAIPPKTQQALATAGVFDAAKFDPKAPMFIFDSGSRAGHGVPPDIEYYLMFGEPDENGNLQGGLKNHLMKAGEPMTLNQAAVLLARQNIRPGPNLVNSGVVVDGPTTYVVTPQGTARVGSEEFFNALKGDDAVLVSETPGKAPTVQLAPKLAEKTEVSMRKKVAAVDKGALAELKGLRARAIEATGKGLGESAPLYEEMKAEFVQNYVRDSIPSYVEVGLTEEQAAIVAKRFYDTHLAPATQSPAARVPATSLIWTDEDPSKFMPSYGGGAQK